MGVGPRKIGPLIRDGGGGDAKWYEDDMRLLLDMNKKSYMSSVTAP